MKILILISLMAALVITGLACGGPTATPVATHTPALLAATASPTASESTPTQTSTTETDSVPQRPVIRLYHGGQFYDGVPGNFCWPVEPGVSLCADEGPFPWQDLDLSAMPVKAEDSIIVEIEADERPQELQAAIFVEASEHASGAAVQIIELDPGLNTPLAVDLPAGVYNVRITGQWDDGDIAYKFKLMVTR